MTVQQVVETELPEVGQFAYQVYQFPSRALLNPERDATVLRDQEISIEPMMTSSLNSESIITCQFFFLMYSMKFHKACLNKIIFLSCYDYTYAIKTG